jgi:hypothetical protein
MSGTDGAKRRISVTIVLLSLVAACAAWWAVDAIAEHLAGSRRIDLGKDLAMAVLGRREPPPPRRTPPPAPAQPQQTGFDVVDARTKEVTHFVWVVPPSRAPPHEPSLEETCNYVERGYCVFTDGIVYDELGALLELREVERNCRPGTSVLEQYPLPVTCLCEGVFEKGHRPVVIAVARPGPPSINVTWEAPPVRGGSSSIWEVRVRVDGTIP